MVYKPVGLTTHIRRTELRITIEPPARHGGVECEMVPPRGRRLTEMADTIIRASALSGWSDCQRRGAAQLFREEIIAAGFVLRRYRRGIAAVVGTAVHKAAADILTEKATSGILPPSSLATDRARDAIATGLAEGEVEYDDSTLDRRDAEHQAISMARAYHTVVAPTVEPIIVEERFSAEIEPGLILSGQPDVVAREKNQVRDLKTTARKTAGNHAPQVGAYALVIRSNDLDIDTAAIDTIRRVRPGRPQPDPVTRSVDITRAESTAMNIIRHIAEDLATWRHGNDRLHLLPGDPSAFLANPSSMLCHPKYCPAFCTNWCREGDPEKLTPWKEDANV